MFSVRSSPSNPKCTSPVVPLSDVNVPLPMVPVGTGGCAEAEAEGEG